MEPNSQWLEFLDVRAHHLGLIQQVLRLAETGNRSYVNWNKAPVVQVPPDDAAHQIAEDLAYRLAARDRPGLT